jgi:formylmethanofuran--tetrahydromethanopterin N-formyltransferase
VSPAYIDDTYAEAFSSLYAEALVTAADRRWLDAAVSAVTGHASSTVMCDCEAGLVAYAAETPDGRPGAVVQFHVPRFRKDRVRALELVLIRRLGQNVLTCPTAAVWNHIESSARYRIGRKLAYFGDGFQERGERHGRRVWVVPVMGGEFTCETRFGYAEGVMGGNLLMLGRDLDAALAAAERALAAIHRVDGVITPFPGGCTWSGSKAGSRYRFLIASTFQSFCPTLRTRVPDSKIPEGVEAVIEIIINGRSLEAVREAMFAGIRAARETPGLVGISAGNYGGRLGRHKIPLRPPAA